MADAIWPNGEFGDPNLRPEDVITMLRISCFAGDKSMLEALAAFRANPSFDLLCLESPALVSTLLGLQAYCDERELK